MDRRRDGTNCGAEKACPDQDIRFCGPRPGSCHSRPAQDKIRKNHAQAGKQQQVPFKIDLFQNCLTRSVPEFIDPVFAKTGSLNSDTG